MSQTTDDTQDLGFIAYQQGDFATALAHWQTLADQQHAQACHNLAMLYQNGEGVPQDIELAKQWCEKAADLGLLAAWHHLGYLLLPSDPLAALNAWQQAAEAGLADAQSDLGNQYLTGEIIPQDIDTAADWYEAAAMQGHTDAQFNLGVLYANAKQYANARYWWEKAAASGHEHAQNNLVRLQEMGF